MQHRAVAGGMTDLGSDFSDLEAFMTGSRSGKAVTLRPVKAKDGTPPSEVLKTVLAAHFGRVIELFREWDDDGNNMVSRKEFRQAVLALGLKVEREDADALFAEFDSDGSGEVDYKELHKVLRPTIPCHPPWSPVPHSPVLQLLP